jgi:hypothetical protein
MIKIILAALLAYGVIMTAVAEQPETVDSAQLARIAEQIRHHRIDVGGDYSMNAKTGRYHIIHADKMMMDCSNCHFGDQYLPDYMDVSRNKPYPAEAKGQYLRSVCLGCHQKGGLATQWYNTGTR